MWTWWWVHKTSPVTFSTNWAGCWPLDFPGPLPGESVKWSPLSQEVGSTDGEREAAGPTAHPLRGLQPPHQVCDTPPPSYSTPCPSSTRTARTRQLGHNSRRNPRLYQQQHQFDSRVSNNWQSFLRLLGVVSKWTYQVGNSQMERGLRYIMVDQSGWKSVQRYFFLLFLLQGHMSWHEIKKPNFQKYSQKISQIHFSWCPVRFTEKKMLTKKGIQYSYFV